MAGTTRGLGILNHGVLLDFVRANALGGFSGLAETPDGGIFCAGLGTGIRRVADGTATRFDAISQKLRPKLILSDRDGSLWVGTVGLGLVHYHQGTVDRFAHADGLSGDTVYAVFEDREKNIWVATEHGLDRFRDFPIVTLSRREGLARDTVGSVFAAKGGGVWIGTTGGLNLLDRGHVSVIGRREGFLFDRRADGDAELPQNRPTK